MLKKKNRIWTVTLTFFENKFKLTYPIKLHPFMYSAEVKKSLKLNNTGNFFKQFVFFVLAVNTVTPQRFFSLKFKSLISAFWQTVSAYAIII